MAKQPVDIDSAPTTEFVLRRLDRDPGIPFLIVGYDESTESVPATHPDGQLANTLFLNSPHLAKRHAKLGWIDVSEQWKMARDGRPIIETPPTSSEDEVLARATSRKRRSRKTTGKR